MRSFGLMMENQDELFVFTKTDFLVHKCSMVFEQLQFCTGLSAKQLLETHLK